MERPNKRPRNSPSTDDSASIVLRSADHSQNILDRLNSQREQGILCDVVLRVGEEEFSAHRVVLSAASDFLQALLTGCWKESKEQVVRLDGIDSDSFRSLLHFIYSGELFADDVDGLLQLLVAAEHLGLASVRPVCIERLLQRLDMPNALQMRLFAQQVGCAELEEAASEVVWGQFTQVVMAGNGFLNLEPQQLEELLMSDKLAVDSEDEVYHALLRWVRHDLDQRQPHLPALLRHVRVALLPMTVLDAMEQEPPTADALRGSEALRAMLDAARRMQAALCATASQTANGSGAGGDREAGGAAPSPEGAISAPVSAHHAAAQTHGEAAAAPSPAAHRRDAAAADEDNPAGAAAPPPPPPSSSASPPAPWGCRAALAAAAALETRPRERRVHRALYACGGKPAWTRVERFDPRGGGWAEVSPMPSRRMRHGAATLGGLVYVAGGKDDAGRVLATVDRYDTHADAWEQVPPMHVARTGVAVGALHGKLYAVGGRHESGHRLKSGECFNAQASVWVPIAPMATARSAARVAALGDRLYVVGGRSDVSPAVASVEAYDPRQDRWIPVAPLRTARVGAGVEAVGGRLFAVGGKDAAGNKLRSVERYDPARDAWDEVASMGTKRWGAGVGVLDGLLYVLGGMNGAERGAVPTVELYDPARDAWSELVPGPALPRGSCTFTAA